MDTSERVQDVASASATTPDDQSDVQDLYLSEKEGSNAETELFISEEEPHRTDTKNEQPDTDINLQLSENTSDLISAEAVDEKLVESLTETSAVMVESKIEEKTDEAENKSTGSDSEGSSFVIMDKESMPSTPTEEIEADNLAASIKEPEEPEHDEECHLLKGDTEDPTTQVHGKTNTEAELATQVQGKTNAEEELATQVPGKTNTEVEPAKKVPEKSDTDEQPATQVPGKTDTDEEPATQAPEKSDTEKEEWIFVLGHDKLKKRVLRAGRPDSRPLSGQVVTVRCVGRLSSGMEVDKQDALTFTLGDGDVIQAFDLCVTLMDENEVCEIFTESQYAYGSLGREPDIPSDSTLTYEVELLKVEARPDYSAMTVEQKMEFGNQKRERGNYLYARNEHAAAINSYTKALKILDESGVTESEDQQKLLDTKVKCYNNLAAAQLKIEAWDAAIKSSEEVLKIQPNNVKALFRKGKCLAGKGEVDTAIVCLKMALKLEPETKIIHQELSKLTSRQKAEEKSEKELYQKMLGTDKKPFLQPQAKKNNMLYLGLAGALVVAGISVAIALVRHNNL